MTTIARTIQRTETFTVTETRTRTTEDSLGNPAIETYEVSVPRARLVTETVMEEVPDIELPREEDIEAPEWPEDPLEPGDEGEAVELVQARLVELGYLEGGEASGAYDDATEAAVRQFQLANGVYPPNGAASAQTLEVMNQDDARTAAQALELAGETRIGAPIGTAGPEPVPTVATLQRATAAQITSEGDARVRATPGGEIIGSLADGTQVSITRPQPEGGAEGWIHVSDGETSGWVADGAGADLVTYDEGYPRVTARLEALGYIAPGGAATPEAIENFQQMNGLEATGALDDATLAAMWSADALTSNAIRQVYDPVYNPNPEAPTHSNTCGPTSVAMATAALALIDIDNADPQASTDLALGHTGTETSEKTTAEDLIAGIAGIFGATEGADGYGYTVGALEEAKLAIAAGDPVIVFGEIEVTNEDGETVTTGHWVLAQGYDPETDTWLVNDPLSRDGVQVWTQDEMEDYYRAGSPSVGVHVEAEG